MSQTVEVLEAAEADALGYADSALLEWVPSDLQRLAYWLGHLYGGEVEPTPWPELGDLRLPELLEWQVRFIEEVLDPNGPDRIAVWGGIGCGKSLLLAIVLYIVAMTRPGSVSLISSDVLKNMQNITIPDCMKVFGAEARFVAGSKSRFEFKNGSIVQVRAYQLASTRDESDNPFEGRTITGLAIIDEVQKLPMKVADHADERTRGVSRDTSGQEFYPKVILNGRPGAIDWWPKLAEERGGVVFRPVTTDNPHNGKRYFEKLHEGRSPREVACLTMGTPMPVKGACFDVWVAEKWPRGNLLDFEHVPALPVTACIDFGRRHPAVLFLQSVKRTIPADITVELFDGSHPKGRTVTLPAGLTVTLDVIFDELMPDDVSLPHLVRLINAKGYDLKSVAVDPAGNNRDDKTDTTSIKLLKRPIGMVHRDGLGGGLGCRVLWTRDAEKTNVEGGILRLQGAMCDGRGVRLLVMSQAMWDAGKAAKASQRTLYHNLQTYSWKHVREKRQNRTGADDPSHGPDALRYWLINYRWRNLGDLRVVSTPKQTEHDKRRQGVARAER